MREEIEQKRQEFEQKRNEPERKRQELEEKLAEEFPFMRRGDSYEEQEASGEIRDLFGAFGYEVGGSGWYDLLRGLCTEVTTAYQRVGLPVDIVVDQVKEKFGKLCFYYHPVGARPGSSELHQEVAKIVHKWEAKSMTVCESCGAPGALRKDIRWVQTLCDQCYIPRKQKIDEWQLKRGKKDGQ